MEYFTTTGDASQRAVDCVIAGVYDHGLGTSAAQIDTASGGLIRKQLKSNDIPTRLGRCVVLTNVPGVRAPRVVVVGLGDADAFGKPQYQRAVQAALQTISQTSCRRVLVGLTLEDADGADVYYLARYTAQAAGEALYRFTAMKSGKKPPAIPLARIGFAIASRGDAARTLRGAEHGEAIAEGVTFARELGNLPANVCTPSYLARAAQKLARDNPKLQTTILNEAQMKRLGMNSLLSVTAGSVEPAKFIVIKYRGKPRAKPVVLVGKGVTFDSGGISLKPGPAMDEMKFDMCGAAAVIATIAVAARLRLPINVNTVVPAVENLPSGSATKPGDIVKSLSGQTIEILNTDAEGRLILCDALTYSRRFNPDTVIDVATLTGACVIALGHHLTGVMSSNDELAQEVLRAGIAAVDRGWHLPLGEDYANQLKSNFADFANVSGRDAGAITAGCFLGKFTDGLNWAHLDIAGTAWKSGKLKGSTGRPVPMLAEFLLARAGALP